MVKPDKHQAGQTSGSKRTYPCWPQDRPPAVLSLEQPSKLMRHNKPKWQRLPVNPKTGIKLLAIIITILISACASTTAWFRDSNPGSKPNSQATTDHKLPVKYPGGTEVGLLQEIRQQIVDGGLSLVGESKLIVKGKTYPFDCTGVILASYAFADIDLAFRFSRYSGNGVRRMFLTLSDEDLLYQVEYPLPGDIIFWDNTYDANNNKLVDDELTHAGLVVAVDDDGLITYLHHHYRLGVVVEYMNLLQPDRDYDVNGRRINSALRMRGLGGDIGTNAAQLFRVFGQGWKLPLVPN